MASFPEPLKPCKFLKSNSFINRKDRCTCRICFLFFLQNTIVSPCRAHEFIPTANVRLKCGSKRPPGPTGVSYRLRKIRVLRENNSSYSYISVSHCPATVLLPSAIVIRTRTSFPLFLINLSVFFSAWSRAPRSAFSSVLKQESHLLRKCLGTGANSMHMPEWGQGRTRSWLSMFRKLNVLLFSKLPCEFLARLSEQV